MYLLSLIIFSGTSYIISHFLLLSNKLISLTMSSSITDLINNKEQVKAVFNSSRELVFGREFANLDTIITK